MFKGIYKGSIKGLGVLKGIYKGSIKGLGVLIKGSLKGSIRVL